MEGAGAGGDEEVEGLDLFGQGGEGELAQGVSQSRRGEDPGVPAGEERLLLGASGEDDFPIGLLENEGGEGFVAQGSEVAGVAAGAGMEADAGAGGRFGGNEAGTVEEDFGEEAVGRDVEGAGAIEEDVGEGARFLEEPGAEAAMEGEAARPTGPHGEAVGDAGEEGGELEGERLRVGEDEDVVFPRADRAGQREPLPAPIGDEGLHSEAVPEVGVGLEEGEEGLGQDEIDLVSRPGEGADQGCGEDGVTEVIAAEDEDVVAGFDACIG